MKLPNGFGSVYKLSGKRRNPWAARKTTGWTWNEEKQKSYPIYQFIGYYPTRQEALTALSDYNKDPYDLHFDTITFKEVYDKWSDIHFQKVKDTNGYEAAYKLCTKILNMKFVEIKLAHLQKVVDESGKNTPTLKNLKILFGLMWDYAVINEIVSQEKRDMIRYIDISKPGNPNSYKREPFRKKEIEMLWKAKDSNIYMTVVLILIYTGLRIGELLDLKKSDVHLEERWFYVREAKTESGIREVPISEKIVPFFEHWMKQNCEYLICTPNHEHFAYRNYYDSYWTPLMKSLSFDKHRPHDTRHTCISLLTEAGVDERVIKKIVGHKGQGVTETVYTHLELPIKLEAINKI